MKVSWEDILLHMKEFRFHRTMDLDMWIHIIDWN